MAASSSRGFVLTGRHVLMGLIVFFGVIITVNTIMVKLALGSFPGEQQKKSYMQGLEYNAVLAARAEHANLGWRAEMMRLPTADRADLLRIRMLDHEGVPLEGLAIEASLFRPTTDEGALEIAFTGIGDGQYEAVVPAMAPGHWDLSLVVAGHPGLATPYEARRRLWIE